MILQLEHITKSFGSRVLFSDVTFRLEEHDRLALVGPNGAGKTTMLNIITGKGRKAWIPRAGSHRNGGAPHFRRGSVCPA